MVGIRTNDWEKMPPSVTCMCSLYYFCVLQEEYEDSSGNVVNKKTYEDLKRQGLL